MGVAALLAIGDELVSGRVREANVAPLSTALLRHGFSVSEVRLLPDDAAAISTALRALATECDVILVTGGLGPTEDDLTADAVAQAAGVVVQRDAGAEAMVRAYFAATGRQASEANLVQADLPMGATALRNPRGTAPGFVLRMQRADVLVLPGVPSEVLAMIDMVVDPWLAGHVARGAARLQRTLVVVGIPEAELGARLAQFMLREQRVLLGSYPAEGEIRLVLSADAVHASELDQVTETVAALLGADLVSATGEGLAPFVVRMACAQQMLLATAESLTGGLLAARLVAVPGASACFAGGVVAYSNSVKQALLGVPAALLEQHGAVSAAVAEAMARSALQSCVATHALSTTGVAGPDGGTAAHPVGTVFIALAAGADIHSRRLQIPGTRDQVRERACTAALDLLRRQGFNANATPSV